MEWTTLNIDIKDISMVPQHIPDVPGGIIDSVTYGYLTIILRVITVPVLAVIAFCAGIVNIMTFAKMNLNQGVNNNLLILSVSDFLLSVVSISCNYWYIMLWLGINSLAGISAVQALTFSLRFLTFPLNVSLIVTTVIAVVRSLSVVMPFSFRDVATVRRQFIAMGVGSAMSLAIPSYTIIGYFSASLSEKQKFMNLNCIKPINCTIFNVSRYIFFFTCLFVIIISMIFLTIALKKSSKFQTLATTSAAEKQSKATSTREAQVIKTVILVLAVNVAGNLPLMVLSIFRIVLPEVSSTGRYRYESGLLEMMVGAGMNLNISLNTPIYFFCNSSFRTVLKSMIGQHSRAFKRTV
ncbi:hypothetical protein RRG08_041862 [Elysia crispata]|uniref:G-protein coupled receptors family 1 profile domain-containing protein n=1 Tax=Elysia crispata TaxID=231223 RepID=A0AAE0Y0F2_9GAST|nr:hypothetical protein RRG08_041862 [Elysia crispata]